MTNVARVEAFVSAALASTTALSAASQAFLSASFLASSSVTALYSVVALRTAAQYKSHFAMSVLAVASHLTKAASDNFLASSQALCSVVAAF